MYTDRMLAVAAVVLLSATACSSSDGNELAVPPGLDASDAPAGDSDAGASDADGASEADGEPGADATGGEIVDAATGPATDVGASTTAFDLAAQPTTPIIEPVPETGVPGIDSSDAFCRAWSEYGGSFQALALISAIGTPDQAYRLEVVASSSVVSALSAMEANLPAELEVERTLFISQLLGPFAARAMAAEAALTAASVDLATLSDTWLATLSEAGLDDPQLTVVLPPSVDGAAVAGVVAMFSASFPLIVDDPDLILDVVAPLTTTYLAETCPDGGVLAGNDEVG